jgi:chitinase
VARKEGNSGATLFVFTITLSAAYDVPVVINFATADGTAKASDNDYVSTSGTLTFAPGETVRTLAVPVAGDRLAEPNETFSVRLIDPENVMIANGVGIGTILDDEPRLAIGDASIIEGRRGTKVMTFAVTLSAAYDEPVTVNFATRDGTATAGEDYVARSGTLTFAPGETVKTITVTVNGDRLREASEYFDVLLGIPSGNALLADGSGRGTILNDD